MSLDFTLIDADGGELFSRNITHNLNKMADAAGIYQALWSPEEIPATQAKELIPLLSAGLIELLTKPEQYTQFNSPNGWGMYEHFVPFVQAVLMACVADPEATIHISR